MEMMNQKKGLIWLKFLVTVLFVLFHFTEANATITVTGSNGCDATTYTSLTGSLAGGSGTTGGVFAKLASVSQAGYNITITLNAAGNITEPGSFPVPSTASSINIYPTVTGVVLLGNNNLLIDFSAASNVVIDGRVNATGTLPDLVIKNTMSTGSAIRFINSAHDNTVKYCTLQASTTSSTNGIILFSTATSGVGNSNNQLLYNDITNSGTRPNYTILSEGSASYPNINNTIANNSFFDFFSLTASGNGIYLKANSSGWTIQGNNFYDTANPFVGTGTTFICINIQAGSGYTIDGNYFGGNARNCSGTLSQNSATNATFYAIYNTVTSGNFNWIKNNTIQNINWQSSTGNIYGIYTANTDSVKNNIIGQTSGTGSIILNNTGAGNITGINAKGTVNGNQIGAIACTGAGAITFKGITLADNSSNTVVNNTIGNTTANSILGFGVMSGIYTTQTIAGTTKIAGNTIQNMQNTSTGSNSTEGIYCSNSNAGSTATLAKNTVTNLSSTAPSFLYGINYVNTGNITLSNNTISTLNQTGTGAAYGINSSTGVGIGSTLSSNTISNITTASGGASGIFAFVATPITIVGNKITNVLCSGTGATQGMFLNGPSILDNNFVYLPSASGTGLVYGLRLSAEQTLRNNIISVGTANTQNRTLYGINNDYNGANPCNYYFNTVYLGGTLPGTTNAYAFFYSYNGPVIISKNNLFVNSVTGGTGKKYAAYYSAYTANTNLTVDYNNYYVTDASYGKLGYYNSVDKTTSVIVTGKDVASMALNPNFATTPGSSVSDYIPGNSALIGVTGTGVSTDYNGTTRSVTAPAIGAMEFAGPPLVEIAGSNGVDGPYATLKQAFEAINGQAMAQSGKEIQVKINSLLTETGTAVLTEGNWTKLRVYPTVTGLNITNNAATFGDLPLIHLNGADNVTIDGRVNATGTTRDLLVWNKKLGTTSPAILIDNSATNDSIKYLGMNAYGNDFTNATLQVKNITGTQRNFFIASDATTMATNGYGLYMNAPSDSLVLIYDNTITSKSYINSGVVRQTSRDIQSTCNLLGTVILQPDATFDFYSYIDARGLSFMTALEGAGTFRFSAGNSTKNLDMAKGMHLLANFTGTTYIKKGSLGIFSEDYPPAGGTIVKLQAGGALRTYGGTYLSDVIISEIGSGGISNIDIDTGPDPDINYGTLTMNGNVYIKTLTYYNLSSTFGGGTIIMNGELRKGSIAGVDDTGDLGVGGGDVTLTNTNNIIGGEIKIGGHGKLTVTGQINGGTFAKTINTWTGNWEGTFKYASPYDLTISGSIAGTENLNASYEDGFYVNGPGTLTLTNAANSYSGKINVNGGTLKLNPTANSTANTMKFILNGGTLSTVGNTKSFTTSGTLTVTGASTLALDGVATNKLKFGASSGTTWTAGLNITNWAGTNGMAGTGATFTVGTDQGTNGLGAANLAKVSFSGYAGIPAMQIPATGEVVPGYDNIELYTGSTPVFAHAYRTLKEAFDAINIGTYTGVITLKQLANTTETATAKLYQSGVNAVGTSSYTSVSLYPTTSGLSITGSGVDAALIDLDGADNVTIDGRVNATGSTADLTISNPSISSAVGTSTIRFFNDASSNAVQYCKIKGSETDASSGIVLVSTGTTTGNLNNTIAYNEITNAGTGRPISAIASIGSTGMRNTGINISNNKIYDFLNPGSTSYGIYLGSNNSTSSITANSFYETTTFTTTAGSSIVINITSGDGYTISDNYIGGSAADHTGTWTKTGSGTTFTGISLNIPPTNLNTINHNTIAGINWTNATAAAWTGINISVGNANIGESPATGNTIGSATTTGSIVVTNTAGNATNLRAINIGGGTVSCQYNTIGGITATNSDNTKGVHLYAISAGGTSIVSNNTIGGTVANSLQSTSTSSTEGQTVVGIQSSGTNTVSGNIIRNLYNGTTNTGGSVRGVNISGGANAIVNNMIALGSNNPETIYGIYDPGTAATNLYHNSVYIGGTVGSGTFPSYALYNNAATAARDYRDNIFMNARATTGGSNLHYAIYLNYSSPGTLTVNYNDYFVSGTGGVLAYYGANYSTLATFKTATTRDGNSYSADPYFIAPTGATPDLHINATIPTVIEGKGIAIGSVTTDYDGQTRSTLTPTDIGADAGNFVSTSNFWTGTVSTDWNTAGNWSAGAIPVATDDVDIPTGLSNYPVIGTNGVCANIFINGGSLTINSTGTLNSGSFGGSISLAAGTTFSFNSATNQTLSGVISGAGSIVDDGAAMLVLTNSANAYTGTTTLIQGELRLNPTAVASFASQVVLNGGKLSTINIANNFASSSTLALTNNSTISLSNVYNLTFANSSGESWTSGKVLTIVGWLGNYNSTSGTGSKIFVGNNNSSLSPAQLAQIRFFRLADGYYYTATQLASGEVVATNTLFGKIWNGTVSTDWNTAANWTPSGVPTLTDYVAIPASLSRYPVIGTGGATCSNISIYGGSLTTNQDATLNSGTYAGNITVAGGATLNLNSSANQLISGIIDGNGEITKNGSGTLTLSGNNQFTSYLTVSAGKLMLGSAGSGSFGPLGASSAYIKCGDAIIDLNGYTLVTSNTIELFVSHANGLINSSSTEVSYYGNIVCRIGDFSSVIANGNILFKGSTIDIKDNSTLYLDGSATGSYIDNQILSSVQTGGVKKLGTGTWILKNKDNNYTGTTTIAQGELRLNPSGTVNAFVSPVVLNGGTLATTNMAYNFTSSGTLELGAYSTLALGTSNTLTFANSSGVAWTEGAMLSITGWQGGFNGTSGIGAKLYVGSGNTGLTSTQLAQIRILNSSNGLYYTATQLTDGEVVPTNQPFKTWTGTTNSAWDVATNWNPSGVPIVTDNVIIPTGCSLYPTLSNGTGLFNTIAILGGSLTVNSSATLNNGDYSGKTYLVSGTTLYLNSSSAQKISGVISGVGNITKNGSGTLTFSANNTFSSTLSIQAGTLMVDSEGSGVYGPLGTSSTQINITGTGILDLNGKSLSASANIHFGDANSSIINSKTGVLVDFVLSMANYAANATGKIDATGGIHLKGGDLNTFASFGSFTFTGTATNSSVENKITSVAPVFKTGTGTWTFTNNGNSYTGITTITAGELRFNPTANATFASPVKLNGGTLATTGIAAGDLTFTSSQTLALSNNSILNLGSNHHTITFANSSAATWTSGKLLTINNWKGTFDGASSGTGGQLFFGAGGLTAAQLKQVRFLNSGTGLYHTGVLLASGELIPTNVAIPAISYTNPAAYPAGVTITDLTPTSTGGAVASCTVSPTLPAGLSISPTGVISGKPTTVTASRLYTVTATNAAQTTTATVTLAVVKGSPGISVSGSYTYIYNGLAQGPAAYTLAVTGTTGAVSYSYTGISGTTYGPSTTKPTVVGNYKVVATVAADANYNASTSPDFNFSITEAPLTIVNIGISNKTYDGLTTASITGPVAYSGLKNGETFTVTGTPVASFATADVGTGKPVTVSGYAAPSSNYSITQPTGLTADITKAALTIVNIGISNKTYDGLTTASITGTAAYSGLQNGETPAIAGTPTASFADAAVGTAKAVTVSGYLAPSSNYSITQPSGFTADITVAPLTILGIGISNKTYDGNTTASITGTAKYSGLQNGESFTVIGSPTAGFATAAAGLAKPVTVTGYTVPSSNYSITQPTGLTADITAAPLTIADITALDKVYDTNNTATLNAGTLSGVVNSDDVSIAVGSGTFADANVGASKAVTATGYSLIGTKSGNYTLTAQPTVPNAAITPATLTYTATAASKVYGEENPTFSGTVTGFVGSDTQSTATTGTMIFASTAAQYSAVGSHDINGSGLTANNGNYIFEQATGNATAFTITQRPLNLTGTKTYDGTVTFAAAQFIVGNTVSGDVVTLGGTADVTSKDVNTYTSLASNSLNSLNANYKVTDGTISATIAQRALTITAVDQNVPYSTSVATVTAAGSYTASGFVNGDNATVITGTPTYTTTYTSTTPQGAPGITITPDVSGLTATNYSFTPANGTITIIAPLARKLTLTVYLEGLWNGTSMNKCKKWDAGLGNLADAFPGDIADLLSVELHDAANYSTIAYTITNLELHQNGTVTSPGLAYIELPVGAIGNYYITINHRNHLATTSANAVSFMADAAYDFTDASTKAYVDPLASFTPMKSLNGKWMAYAGNTNYTGANPVINSDDYLQIFDNYSDNTGVFGYTVNDLNGDGSIDFLDFVMNFNNNEIYFYKE